MNKSESITKLATALVKAQSKMPSVKMNAVNPFLKNKYADLGAVISASRPALVENGLAIIQTPISDGERIGLTTMLVHESGEWIESTLFLNDEGKKGLSSAQNAGGTISYLRRYSWASILGLYADEDTDGGHGGNSNGGSTTPTSKQSQPVPATQKPAANGQRPYEPEALKAHIEAKAKELTGKPVKGNEAQVIAMNLDEIFLGDKSTRHAVLHYLTGHQSATELPDPMKLAVKAWIKPTQNPTSGEWKMDAIAEKEAHAVYKAAMIAQGQTELFETSAA